MALALAVMHLVTGSSRRRKHGGSLRAIGTQRDWRRCRAQAGCSIISASSVGKRSFVLCTTSAEGEQVALTFAS